MLDGARGARGCVPRPSPTEHRGPSMGEAGGDVVKARGFARLVDWGCLDGPATNNARYCLRGGQHYAMVSDMSGSRHTSIFLALHLPIT